MSPPPNPTPANRCFRPGEYLFREKDLSRSVYLIKRGTVSIRKTKRGGQVEIARIYSNELIGELSFFDRAPRSAAAMALTEVETVEIPFESLEKIFAGVPDYFKTIVASLASRLRRANEQIRRLDSELVAESSARGGNGDFSATEALAAVEGAQESESPAAPDEPGTELEDISTPEDGGDGEPGGGP